MSKHVNYYRGYEIETTEFPNLRTAHLTATGPLVLPSLAADGYKLKIKSDGTVYAAADTGGGTGSGDMLAATYDAAGIEEQLVGLTATQTLTNKTLTSPAITTPTGIVKGDVGLGNVDNTADADKPISTATQNALDLKAQFTDATHVVYVSQVGNDSNDGLAPDAPKLTIGAALTAAAALTPSATDSVVIKVEDGGTYTENLTIGTHIKIVAPGITLVGEHTINDNSVLIVDKLYRATDTADMVEKNGSTSHSHVFCNIADARGIGGVLTGNAVFRNGTGGGLLHVHADVMYVPASAIGIADQGSGGTFGHTHYSGSDIYLAGNNAKACRTGSSASQILIEVHHILQIGTPTGTEAAYLNFAGSQVWIDALQIDADVAWNISAGDLYVSCPDVSGTKTGTAIFDLSGDFVKLTGDQTVAGVKTFSSFPVTPSSAPTTNYQVANKKYVDDSITGGGLGDMLVSVYDAAGVSEQLVGLTATQTLTNKTLTSPAISNPTGLDSTDVGLSNVTNDAQVPLSTGTTKGDIIGYTASATVARLAVGTNGQVLTAASGEATGLSWASLTSSSVGLGNVTNTAQIPLSTGTAKGDIVAYTASATVARLGVGSDGQVIKAASGQATGLEWASLSASDVSLGNVTNTAQVPLSTGTTKGDLLAYTASATIARLGVGTDGQVLTAASGQSTGLSWATPSTPVKSFSTATSLTIDMSTREYVRVTLSSGGTLSLSNVTTGKEYFFLFQDTGASGYTVTLPTAADIASAGTFDVPAGEFKEVAMIYDGTNRIWQISEDLAQLT